MRNNSMPLLCYAHSASKAGCGGFDETAKSTVCSFIGNEYMYIRYAVFRRSRTNDLRFTVRAYLLTCTLSLLLPLCMRDGAAE